MKSTTILLFIVICIVNMNCKKDKAETKSNVNLAQGLLGYYPFNGNVNDESGNGNNGTIVNNATIVADKNGKPQSALSVNGSNGVMVANGAKLMSPDEMTISFDVMARQLGRQVYVSTINYTTGFGFGYFISSSIPGDTRSVFATASNGFNCNATNNQPANTVFGTSFEKESWYTVVATFKNGAQKIYINGNLAGEATSLSVKLNVCPNTNFLIGTWWQNDLAGLNGKIDNVRVYNRVINADEIKALNN